MGLDENCSRWYALYLRSRYEKRVDTDLRSRGLESFLPLIQETHFWSDRKKKVMEPMFRGYLFVRTNLSDRIAILQTDGVVGFVSIRSHPSPIPDEQINWIKILVKHPDAIQPEAFVREGEKVRVTGGPFEGVEGIVREVKGSMRVLVSLEAIARSVSVEVGAEYLERCSR